MTNTSTPKPTKAQRAALERAATGGYGWSKGVNGNTFNGLIDRGYLVIGQDGQYVISDLGRAALVG